MKKKFIIIASIFILAITLTGCGKANLDMDLTTIMDKVYEGIDEDKLPMALTNTEITKDNLEYYTGLKELDYKEALASESMVGSIAHSVVLIRLNDSSKIENVKSDIKEKINPQKWICVGVDNILIDNIGDTIIVVLNDEIGDQIINNFKKLK